MKDRKDVSIEETWDLSLIFETVEEFEEKLKLVINLGQEFYEKYFNNLKNAKDVENSLSEISEIYKLIDKLSAYASLAVEADTLDDEANVRYQKMRAVLSRVFANFSFFDNALLSLDENILRELGDHKEYGRTIKKVLSKKPYALSNDVEKSLSILSNTLDFPYQLYNDTKFRDIKFPDIKVNEKTYPMTYNNFEGHLEMDDDKDLRREAFKVFSENLRKYQYTTASTYNAQVQKEKQLADLRGYKTVFDYLLHEQEVSMEMYNRQIDVIMTELAPHMRKYATLLKKIHNLEEIRYSDLKIEVDPTYSPDLTYDEAKKYVLEGLSVLGEDYLSIIKNAFDNRWIDYAENKGKRTGAFCSTPYGVNAFVLMSFNNKMNEVMTLAHELGHAGHFVLAGQNQNILNTDCSMYFVEAPSTTNELIVENYLLDQAKDDKRLKRWVLSQIVSKTYYHNFVTHFMEAAFQREVYKLVDAGEFLDADKLNEIFLSKLKEFWGEEIVFDDGAELTWMRQPHYYMGLYPYTYSAGLTIGTQVAMKIRQNKEESKNWIEVLKLGGSFTPEELAKKAGVDISTDKPLKDTIEYIGSLIDEIEEISIQLGEIC